MARTKKTEDGIKYEQKCPTCGRMLSTKKSSGNFYLTHSPIYKYNFDDNGSNIHIVCRDCMNERFEANYKVVENVYQAVVLTCMKYDIPFDDAQYEAMLRQVGASGKTSYFKTYMQKLNSFGYQNGCDNEFSPEMIVEKGLVEEDEVEEKEYNIEKPVQKIVKLSDEALLAKNDVIGMLGHDCFIGYDLLDQETLYPELLNYLDEDTLEDNFKLSQVMQIVVNNNQIKRIDLQINRLIGDLSMNHGDVKSLSDTKSKIVASTDKIAKENSISVKNRSDKRSGRSTLTYKMKELRELNFREAEANYYDQMKAIGMQRVSDISAKSIWEQLQFDENDYTVMIKEQKDLIAQLYKQLDELKEEVRKIHAGEIAVKGEFNG
jgi:hypothetical protein